MTKKQRELLDQANDKVLEARCILEELKDTLEESEASEDEISKIEELLEALEYLDWGDLEEEW